MIYTEELAIDEGQSYDIFSIPVYQEDGVTPLVPDEVEVQIFVPSDSSTPVWVNNRNGANKDGLNVASNVISMHLHPEDNQIIDAGLYAKTGFEHHVVRFKILYNNGTDVMYLEINANIRDQRHIS